jgi:hypothetical protein
LAVCQIVLARRRNPGHNDGCPSVVEYDASWWDEDPSDERITLREIPVWKDNDDANPNRNMRE